MVCRCHVSVPTLKSFSRILCQVHQETCRSSFKDHPGRGSACRSPPLPPHRGRGLRLCRALPADPAPPPAPRPRGTTGKTPRGCKPHLDPLLLHLRGTTSSFVPPGPRGPGPRPVQPAFLCPAVPSSPGQVPTSPLLERATHVPASAPPPRTRSGRHTQSSDTCLVNSSSKGFARMSRSGPISSINQNRVGIHVTGRIGEMFFQN